MTRTVSGRGNAERITGRAERTRQVATPRFRTALGTIERGAVLGPGPAAAGDTAADTMAVCQCAIDGAEHRAEAPGNWNGTLTLWSHADGGAPAPGLQVLVPAQASFAKDRAGSR